MSFGIPVRNGLAIGLLSSTTLSSNGGLFPAMALDFLQPYLDSRVTFSRGSNATLVDATGKITYAPANLVLQSQTFDDASWTKNNITVVANATTAPDSTTTADRIVPSTSSVTNHRVQITPSYPAATYSVSVYAKADGYNWLKIRVGAAYANFNVSSGVTGLIGGTTISSNISSAGNGWYRCNLIVSSTGGDVIYFYVATTNNAGLDTDAYAGDGTSGLFIWGAQLEPVTYQTTPGTYNATTSAAYYGPRFDYDPVTLAPKGLLIEEQRTNLLTYSEQFDNAAWNKSSVTVTANTVSAPDGTATADTLTSSGASGTIFQPTPSTSASFTYSVYVRPDTVTTVELQIAQAGNGFKVAFNLTNGTAGTAAIVGTGGTVSAMTGAIVSAGGGWYRCSVSYTSGGVGNAFLNIPAAGVVYAWGAQLEAGSFATSYIPTVASTVTRSADIATMTGTNFSSWYNATEGSLLAEVLIASKSGSYGIYAVDDGTTNNAFPSFHGGTAQANARVGGAGVFSGQSAALPATPAVLKIGFAYATSNYAASFNGGTLTTQLSGAIPSGLNRLQIGAYNGIQLNGHIRQIAYYNTRLTNTQLQTLTAPSLVTTLSLDFINGVYNA